MTILSHARSPSFSTRLGARKAAGFLSWAYIGGLIAFWLLIRFAGDRWWLATILLFGPRWVALLPLAALVPLVAIFRRRYLLLLAVGTWFALFVVLDMCVPWRSAIAPAGHGQIVRILTLNTHYEALKGTDLANLIDSTAPDIVALQEFGPEKTQEVFHSNRWHLASEAYGCVASQFPIRKIETIAATWGPRPGDATLYEVQLPGRTISVISLHLVSPHSALHDALHGLPLGTASLEQNSLMRTVEANIVGQRARDLGPDVLVAGDFNLPEDSSAFRNNFSNLSDAFAVAGLGFGWTYYTPWTATRIDHVLAGEHWRYRKCWVGPDLGLPHRPLIAELELSDSIR